MSLEYQRLTGGVNLFFGFTLLLLGAVVMLKRDPLVFFLFFVFKFLLYFVKTIYLYLMKKYK